MLLWLVRSIGDGQLQAMQSQSLACPAVCILRRGDRGELVLTSVVLSSPREAYGNQRLLHRRIWSQMGNQHSSSSRSTPASSQPQSPVGSSNQHASHAHSHLGSSSGSSGSHHHLPHPGYRTGRRASIQPVTLTQVAPPTASFESVERGRATQANSTAHVTSQLRAAQGLVREESSDMGNEQSSQKKEREREERQERLSRQSTPQPAPSSSVPPPPPTSTATPPQAKGPSPPVATSTPPPSEVHAIPIEAPHNARTEEAIAGSLEPADASQDYIVPSSHFSRPPRLPLPIEEEVHTPGSPIISPTDPELASPLDPSEVEGTLPRRTSMLSSTTADDDDLDLGEEFKVPTPGRPTVPTLIEWEGAGERVYVTGTFAGWNRKYRLHEK